MAVIREDQIVTRLTVEGLEDLNKAKANLNDINKTKVNIDTKGVTDFGKAVKDVADKEIANLNNKLKTIPPQLKNLDPALLDKFVHSLEGVTDEFDILSKTVKFTKDNIDKIKPNLTAKEFEKLTAQISASEQVLNEQGKGLVSVGQKSKTLTGQLRAVREELTKLDQAGQSGTSAYKNLQVQAGKLQDEIGDNRAAVKALASDTLKLDAGVGAIRGVVAGFTAYQGILGLAGVKNKEFEATLLKINGAMAILQGLQEITNLLQAQSATRLVATSIAQNIWNSSIAFANRLLGIKIATTEADIVATEQQAVATELSTAATNTATVSTGAFTIALATTLALVAAIGFAIYTAVDAFKYFTSNMLKTTEEIDKENEALLKQIGTMAELQKIRKGGTNDLQRELELIKSKGGSLDEIYKKEKQIADQEVKDAQARLDKLNSLPGLTPTKLLEIRKIEDEIRNGKAKTSNIEDEFYNKKLASEAKIQAAKDANIRTEYEKSIKSIEDQGKEEIRLIKANNDLTSPQKIALAAQVNTRINQDKLKIELDFNKKISDGYIALYDNVYSKQIAQLESTQQQELRKYKQGSEQYLQIQALQETQLEDLKKKLREKADLDIKNIQTENIKDEYDRKIKQLEAVSKAEIKAFVGTDTQLKAFSDESDKKLTDAKVKAALDREQKIQDLRTSLILNDYVRGVQAAQDAYDKDLANYSYGEEKKAEYTLLLERQKNNKIGELERVSIRALAEIHIANINSVSQRETAIAEKRVKDDVRNFLKTIDIATLAGKIKFANFSAEVLKRLNNDLDKAKHDFTSLGEILFGDGDDAKTLARVKAFNTIVSESLNIFKTVADAAVASDDAQISSAERRITRFRELADKGGAEQLQKQQDYLDALQAKREKDLEQQRAIAAAQILINDALAVSNSIKAVTQAFSDGTLIDGILTSIALTATVASAIISVNSALTSVPGFKGGVDRLSGQGTETSDSIPAKLSKNEKVMTGKQNKEMGYPTNLEVVKYFKIGKQAADGSIIPGSSVSNSVNYYYQGDQKEGLSTKILKELHRDVIDTKTALNKFKVEIKIRDKQFHAMVQSVQSGIDHQKSKR